jgi:hypothetical protein
MADEDKRFKPAREQVDYLTGRSPHHLDEDDEVPRHLRAPRVLNSRTQALVDAYPVVHSRVPA